MRGFPHDLTLLLVPSFGNLASRASLTSPRPHGFASPPYDGFARSRRCVKAARTFRRRPQSNPSPQIGAAGACCPDASPRHKTATRAPDDPSEGSGRIPGQDARLLRSYRRVAIVERRLLVGAEQRAIGVAGQSPAMLGPGRFQDGRLLEQVPGGGGEGAGGEDHPLAADARPPAATACHECRGPRDPASRRETGRRHDHEMSPTSVEPVPTCPVRSATRATLPRGGRARSPARVSPIPSANADSSASKRRSSSARGRPATRPIAGLGTISTIPPR